jgi:carbamoyl-phosphate synthase large subunit
MPARRLADLGFRILATRGTAAVLARAGIPVTAVLKRSEGSPNAADLIEAGEVALVVNTPFGRGARTDGYFIRTAAARAGVPCITTMPGIMAAVQGVEALRSGRPVPRSLQEYHAGIPAPVVQPALVAIPEDDAGIEEGAAKEVPAGGGPP